MSGLVITPGGTAWSTIGDTPAWTLVGTPTRSAAAAYIGTIPLDLVVDDAAGTLEEFYRAPGFSHADTVTVSFVVKRSSAYAYHSVLLYDATAVDYRLATLLDFTTTTLGVTASAGAVLYKTELATGVYRVTCLSTAVIPANDTRLYVIPANYVTTTAQFYIGDMELWETGDAVALEVSAFTEGPPVYIGETSRSFNGIARSSVRGTKRTWQATTALYGKSVYDALLLACATEQPCHVSGDCFPGGPVNALVRPTYELVGIGETVDGSNFVYRIGLQMDEV